MVFHPALCIIATNTNAKFQVNQTGDDKVMLWTKNYSNKLSNSRPNNSTCSDQITPIIKLIRDLKSHIYMYFDQLWN